MDKFFEWLSNPGPWEEISVIIVLILFIVGLPICLKYIKVAKISKQGIEFDTKDENSKSNTTSHVNTVKSNKYSNIISQDHMLFNLILRDFTHKIKLEVKEYCKMNGLNRKSDEEYREYTEEKKSIYYSLLKDKIRSDYISYDDVTLEDVEEILESLRDYTFHRIEVLFRKIRDISIDDHKIIDKEKEDERKNLENNIIDFARYTKNDADSEKRLKSILDLHYIKYETLIARERIDILERQIHVIDEVNKSISSRFIEEFEKVYRNKQNNSNGGTNA